MNGVLVGQWRLLPGGNNEFCYAQEWLDFEGCRPLSLSLPINFDRAPLTGDAVLNFFENLLPDSDLIRRRLQARFNTASRDAFDLLLAIGRDCVGAVQLLPVDMTPPGTDQIPLQLESLDEAAVARCLRHAVAGAAGLGRHDDPDDFRISIAGAQEKTALTLYAGQWHRPSGVTPSTHIFKLPLGLVGGFRGDMQDSVENEWLCSQILKEYGLSVASSQIRQFADQRTLVVERFDRLWSPDHNFWFRLPQEDMCQALGVAPNAKYETDGGPGIEKIAKLLQASTKPEQDLISFLKAQLVMWLLAATDGHAKNFSIHLLPGGRFQMTPLYDVISAWPIIGHGPNKLAFEKTKMAMAQLGKGRHYKLGEIQRRHFIATAERVGISQAQFAPIIDDIIARTDQVLDAVHGRLPEGFPAALFDAVATGVRQGSRRIV